MPPDSQHRAGPPSAYSPRVVEPSAPGELLAAEMPISRLGWSLGLGALVIIASLALGVHLYYARAGVGNFGFPLDDSWIHLQIARNVATGPGWSYNPGEPTGASTAPLWVALLAPLFWLPGDVTAWVKLLGALLFLANVLLVADLVRLITRDARCALLAGLLVALSGPYLWGALSGMEAHLSLLLVLLGLRAAVTAGGAGRRSYLATFWLALAMWARPEFLALVPLVWGYIWWQRRAAGVGLERGGELRYWAPHLLIVVVSLAAFAGFNLAVSGQPLPATWQAKRAFSQGSGPPSIPARLARPAGLLMRSVQELIDSQNALLGLTIALGALAYWRAGGRRRAGVGLLIGAVVVSVLAAVAASVGSVGFQGYRRAAYVIACMAALAAMGGVTAWDLLRTDALIDRPRDALWHARRGASWLLLALVLLMLAAEVRHSAIVYTNDTRSINQGDVAAARWIAENTPADALIAVNDIGALGYFGGRRLLDLGGLASPEVVAIFARHAPDSAPRDAELRDLILAKGVQYVVIFPQWYPFLSKDPILTEVTRFQVPFSTSLAYDTVVVYKVIPP